MREEFKRELLEELYKLGYRYLATDADGEDSVFKTEPKKCDDIWRVGTCSGAHLLFSLGFSSWDDTEPFNIANYLGYDIDWFQVPIDAKILVSDDDESWCKRHFAKYENEKVYAWEFGFTSWTTGSFRCYNYAKLAEEPIEEPNKTIDYENRHKDVDI